MRRVFPAFCCTLNDRQSVTVGADEAKGRAAHFESEYIGTVPTRLCRKAEQRLVESSIECRSKQLTPQIQIPFWNLWEVLRFFAGQHETAIIRVQLELTVVNSDLKARGGFRFHDLLKLSCRNQHVDVFLDDRAGKGYGYVEAVVQVGGSQLQIAIDDSPSQVVQHRECPSLWHHQAEPFECRFEEVGVDHSHSKLL